MDDQYYCGSTGSCRPAYIAVYVSGLCQQRLLVYSYLRDCGVASWFHDKISRKDAEKLLVETNNQPGTFIVRESETVAGIDNVLQATVASPAMGTGARAPSTLQVYTDTPISCLTIYTLLRYNTRAYLTSMRGRRGAAGGSILPHC